MSTARQDAETPMPSLALLTVYTLDSYTHTCNRRAGYILISCTNQPAKTVHSLATSVQPSPTCHYRTGIFTATPANLSVLCRSTKAWHQVISQAAKPILSILPAQHYLAAPPHNSRASLASQRHHCCRGEDPRQAHVSHPGVASRVDEHV